MKKTITTFLFAAFFAAFSAFGQEILQGYLTANKTLTADKVWKLQGFVYVTSGVTLTIEAGTKIVGDKASKGTLIVTRGGKINAVGTASSPIVFTSNETVKGPGDWGGIIILGKAKNNDPSGEKVIEGGVDDAQGSGKYGGTDDADNSGKLKYVRIEYPGIAFSQDNEINGLTMGGVGSGTEIDYVQVSYSGDDSFEWFGGTVNCKHLIAYRGTDDDFDTDFGYTGNVQFALSVRDPFLVDVASGGASNSFECDNDGSGSDNQPFTAPTFSNVTVIGANWSPNALSAFKRAAHIRRNARTSIYNSALMNFPVGLLLDGGKCEAAAASGALEIKNTFLVGNKDTLKLATGSTFDVNAWFKNTANANAILGVGLGAQGKLTDPYNLVKPSVLPKFDSPLRGAASFASARISGAFFEKVGFAGAFGDSDWACSWAAFELPGCQLTSANEFKTVVSEMSLAPTMTSEVAFLSLELVKNSAVSVDIVSLDGKTVAAPVRENVAAGAATFELNVSNLETGFYLVRVAVDGKVGTQKLIVAR